MWKLWKKIKNLVCWRKTQKHEKSCDESQVECGNSPNVSKAVSQLPQWASRLQVNQPLHSCFQRVPLNLANVNTLLFYYLESEHVNKIENMMHLLCFKVFKNTSIWHYVHWQWDSFADDINILKIWILLNDWKRQIHKKKKNEMLDNGKCISGRMNTARVLFAYSEVKSLSRVWLFSTPWTVAHQAPPSMEFSRQEYWSGLPFPSPGDLLDPGIKPGSPTLRADTLPSEPPGNPKRRVK